MGIESRNLQNVGLGMCEYFKEREEPATFPSTTASRGLRSSMRRRLRILQGYRMHNR